MRDIIFYQITGNQDGVDYGIFGAYSEQEAIELMLREADVEELEINNFTARELPSPL